MASVATHNTLCALHAFPTVWAAMDALPAEQRAALVAALEGVVAKVLRQGERPEAPPTPPWLVVIAREGVPEVTPFEYEEDARAFESTWGTQWSESYVCRVIKGPVV